MEYDISEKGNSNNPSNRIKMSTIEMILDSDDRSKVSKNSKSIRNSKEEFIKSKMISLS